MTQMENLHDIHPRLIEAVKRISYACHELGIEPVVSRVSARPRRIASGKTDSATPCGWDSS
jgi:hypothetical protein